MSIQEMRYFRVTCDDCGKYINVAALNLTHLRDEVLPANKWEWAKREWMSSDGWALCPAHS